MTSGKRGTAAANQRKRVLILGVGNVLLSDEGVGVHVAQRMMDMDLPPGVEVMEGGTDGFGLMHVLLQVERLILVDAVKGGGPPGSIYRFGIEDCPPFPDVFKTSVHQVSILEVINLSGLIGSTPRTTVIGVEPKRMDMGMELSPEIEAKIPKVIQLIEEEVATSLRQISERQAVEASLGQPRANQQKPA